MQGERKKLNLGPGGGSITFCRLNKHFNENFLRLYRFPSATSLCTFVFSADLIVLCVLSKRVCSTNVAFEIEKRCVYTTWQLQLEDVEADESFKRKRLPRSQFSSWACLLAVGSFNWIQFPFVFPPPKLVLQFRFNLPRRNFLLILVVELQRAPKFFLRWTTAADFVRSLLPLPLDTALRLFSTCCAILDSLYLYCSE